MTLDLVQYMSRHLRVDLQTTPKQLFIIIIENEFSDLHVMPSELNVKTIAGRYDHAHSNNILQVVQTSLDSHNQKVFSSMLENCFYFNDGHSIDRIIDFLGSRFS